MVHLLQQIVYQKIRKRGASPRLAALLSERDRHFIDHLSPLSSLLNIPIIVSDQEVEALIQAYYPQVEVIYQSPLNLGFYLLTHFDIIYTCLPNSLFREQVFVAELLANKTLFNVWCPHGNSDKGHKAPFMETLCEERFALVYGQNMIDFLREKGSLQELKEVLTTGNYRLKYYKTHKNFFQKKLKERLFLKKGKTILYAPTWKDGEGSSSIEGAFHHLIKEVPEDLNLLIKLHPNVLFFPEYVEQLFHQISGKPNVQILTDFPLIYPLLDWIDIYLGDMSSIGYDCLSFKKPLFFLSPHQRDLSKEKGLFLLECGTVIEPKDYPNIFSIIKRTNTSRFEKTQTALYAQVFGEEENLKDRVVAAYEKES